MTAPRDAMTVLRELVAAQDRCEHEWPLGCLETAIYREYGTEDVFCEKHVGTKTVAHVPAAPAIIRALALIAAADAGPPWDDRPDEWSEAISAAHPVRSGAHDAYGVAMRMVGNRQSKRSLVDLVTWLLVRADIAEANAAKLAEVNAERDLAMSQLRRAASLPESYRAEGTVAFLDSLDAKEK